ncbi:type II CAAX endopeptidase family protein [Spiroplasma sp. SV19]|uniref:CPBP family intramembrane glutamic endopeptidase n=1 Tax=Spiroplasma sp. SV19 TaxID=2570468 RepID=UPI0024B82DF9|nr:type II CAAX endopeptidase family protein [Spiroplasma sp. SV19]WHQ36793.1 CPBP family intramembrane metalloprotease [Spiroplasma sp. SV19]
MNNNENTYNNFKRPWYELKPTLVDRASPFDFKLVNVRNTGYIFIGTAIFAPFFISILISYLFAHNQYSLVGMNFVSWIIVAVGSYFVINGAQSQIMRSGAIVFYYFYFIPNIVGLLIGIIANLFQPSASALTTINLLTSLIAAVVTLLISYKTSPFIFKKIKLTFKQDYQRLLLVSLVAIIVVFLFNFGFGWLQSLITSSSSKNQDSLIKGLDKWWNVVILVIYTVFVAPIIEELACRHGIFSLRGNKWIGFVASTIFFAGMHVSSTGDWEHIIGYLGAALALGMLFIIVNGNVTYNIIAHGGLNLISTILILTLPDLLIK